jgi:peptide/nickel transport system permease protein
VTAYTIRRVGQGLIVVLIVTFLTLLEAHMMPGNPARDILGVHASQAQIQAFDVKNGYNRALPIQYWMYLGRLLHGNLGFSYVQNQPVSSLLGQALINSSILVGIAVVFSLLVAIPLAVVQAVRRYKIEDYLLTGVTFAFYSMPTFWFAMMLVLLFSAKAHLLPAVVLQGPPLQILENPKQLVLPVLTLAMGNIATFSRYLRSSVLDNLTMDYVRTARAIGNSNRRVLSAHVLKNALAPVITMLGLALPSIMSGALMTESIFNYPGMGMLYWQSSQNRDYPVMLGATLVVTLATVVGTLLADLAYAIVDPRIRYVRSGS